MASKWITHVKEYASSNNISFKEAMKQAGATYNKGASTTDTKPTTKSGRARDSKGRYI
jgi:hypothetical protein